MKSRHLRHLSRKLNFSLENGKRGRLASLRIFRKWRVRIGKRIGMRCAYKNIPTLSREWQAKFSNSPAVVWNEATRETE